MRAGQDRSGRLGKNKWRQECGGSQSVVCGRGEKRENEGKKESTAHHSSPLSIFAKKTQYASPVVTQFSRLPDLFIHPTCLVSSLTGKTCLYVTLRDDIVTLKPGENEADHSSWEQFRNLGRTGLVRYHFILNV